MLYILLCGYPPFHGDNEKKIFEAVRHALGCQQGGIRST
jgi:hypothetical protein